MPNFNPSYIAWARSRKREGRAYDGVAAACFLSFWFQPKKGGGRRPRASCRKATIVRTRDEGKKEEGSGYSRTGSRRSRGGGLLRRRRKKRSGQSFSFPPYAAKEGGEGGGKTWVSLKVTILSIML